MDIYDALFMRSGLEVVPTRHGVREGLGRWVWLRTVDCQTDSHQVHHGVEGSALGLFATALDVSHQGMN